jgi:oxygen-independent coproporphyrinogen-3 oxidase
MTRFGVHLDSDEAASAPVALESLLEDGLVRLDGERLTIPAEGRPFLRNAASFFDEYFEPGQPAGPRYSSSV